MILEGMILIGGLLTALGLLGLLYPWNGVSVRFGGLITFIGIMSLIITPISTIETPLDWDITPQNADTSGWGEIGATWNEAKDSITIPVRIDSNNDYNGNNTRLPFYIRPVLNTQATSKDYATITIEIKNYSAIINNHYLLKRTKGAFWANITDPDGIGSGNSYKKVYNMKYQEQGTFYVDFKLNPGSATLNTLGEIADLYILIYDSSHFYKEYQIRFICIGD